MVLFKKSYLVLGFITCLLFSFECFSTEPIVSINHPVTNSFQPIVLTATQLNLLKGINANAVRVYKNYNGNLIPIPFQIDQRDEKQRYVLKKSHSHDEDENKLVLDDNDELVFMLDDTGQSPYEYKAQDEHLLEIKLVNNKKNNQHWVYINIDAEITDPMSADFHIRYNPDNDSIETNSYSMGFNTDKPFILNNFQRMTSDMKWSGNLIDTMKVEHTGEFLHFIDFYRNYNDYSSTLSNVKIGPVRVIRRTKNKVYIFMGLESPEIEMDYIIYKDCFFVDTLIDIPFEIGTFFSNIKTRLSVDWNKQVFTTDMRLYSNSFKKGFIINGEMSETKQRFSEFKDESLMLDSRLGTIMITMFIPDDLPINFHNFLLDDINTEEKPENQPGQWGHYGYMTTEWENVDARPHHMQFQVYMTPAKN